MKTLKELAVEQDAIKAKMLKGINKALAAQDKGDFTKFHKIMSDVEVLRLEAQENTINAFKVALGNKEKE